MTYALPTLAELRTNCRDILDEPTAAFWLDAQLTRWINQAIRDIARRTEVILSFNQTISAVAGTAKYNLPADVVRVHRVEYTPTGQQQTYNLMAKTYEEMDMVWGINQFTPSSYPSYYVLWGQTGSAVSDTRLKMQVFPIPSAAGTFNLFYYRLPNTLSGDSDIAEIPAGWDDAVTMFVEYMAKRKSRDPTWKDAKDIYEEKIAELVDVSRQLHDQAQFIQSSTGIYQPYWLYSDWDW